MFGTNYDAGYSTNDSMVYHFYQHARFGTAKKIDRRGITDKNFLEKIGDLGLWVSENFPGKIWKQMQNPRLITLFFTTVTLTLVTFLFYPKETVLAAKELLKKIVLPSREQVKFASYLCIVNQIVATAFRAYGRFSNKNLMATWYSSNLEVIDV